MNVVWWQSLKQKTLHTDKLEYLDLIIYKWFLGEQAEGKPVLDPSLAAEAHKIYEKMGSEVKCEFSQGWLVSRFEICHGIQLLDSRRSIHTSDK